MGRKAERGKAMKEKAAIRSQKIGLEFAATTIGIMLTMLREKGYSDHEIANMLGRDKVKEMLKILSMPTVRETK